MRPTSGLPERWTSSWSAWTLAFSEQRPNWAEGISPSLIAAAAGPRVNGFADELAEGDKAWDCDDLRDEDLPLAGSATGRPPPLSRYFTAERNSWIWAALTGVLREVITGSVYATAGSPSVLRAEPRALRNSLMWTALIRVGVGSVKLKAVRPAAARTRLTACRSSVMCTALTIPWMTRRLSVKTAVVAIS